MDLRSGTPFWLSQNGGSRSPWPLREDVRCDVLVVGGGITGALLAYYLVQAGIDTVLVDRRNFAHGSTSASTGLLLYELDTHLCDLIRLRGKSDARRAYHLSLEAVRKFALLARQLHLGSAFQKRKSLYLASRPGHATKLREEFKARKTAGIPVEFLESEEIARQFPFSRSAALLSEDAGQIDPYRVCCRLLDKSIELGLRAYDRTAIKTFECSRAGLALKTDRNFTIRAGKTVFATGYEFSDRKKSRLVRLSTTYALASKPVQTFEGWPGQCLIWESARPYLYLRATVDRRVLIGGADEKLSTGERRDSRINRKALTLQQNFKEMFPGIRIKPVCAWAGTFAETKDGLPFITADPDFPRSYVALGYGGNGITFGLIAAEIIRDLCLGKPNPDQRIFKFNR